MSSCADSACACTIGLAQDRCVPVRNNTTYAAPSDLLLLVPLLCPVVVVPRYPLSGHSSAWGLQ